MPDEWKMKKDKKVSEQREREREKQERKATARGDCNFIYVASTWSG